MCSCAEAVALLQAHRATHIALRDAVHAATMQNHGIGRILSADSHFDVFPFLSRTDPAAYQSP